MIPTNIVYSIYNISNKMILLVYLWVKTILSLLEIQIIAHKSPVEVEKYLQ